LVLEAETLIEDALAEEGKSRYIINDDEFSHASTVLKFAKRLSDLDASVVVRFGDPMDVIGNPVDGEGRSLNVDGSTFDRAAYVTDGAGQVATDMQRDRVYTNHLAQAICRAYQRDTVVLPTHLAAFAGWHCLGEKFPSLDRYHRALLAPFERWIDRGRMVAVIAELMVQLDQKAAEGLIRLRLPEGSDRAELVLSSAVATFGRFHSRAGLAFEDWRVLVDPKLALYYGNRLAGVGLKIGEPS
jgi:glycerol-3-phosphate O-acyltransferase